MYTKVTIISACSSRFFRPHYGSWKGNHLWMHFHNTAICHFGEHWGMGNEKHRWALQPGRMCDPPHLPADNEISVWLYILTLLLFVFYINILRFCLFGKRKFHPGGENISSNLKLSKICFKDSQMFHVADVAVPKFNLSMICITHGGNLLQISEKLTCFFYYFFFIHRIRYTPILQWISRSTVKIDIMTLLISGAARVPAIKSAGARFWFYATLVL